MTSLTKSNIFLRINAHDRPEWRVYVISNFWKNQKINFLTKNNMLS